MTKKTIESPIVRNTGTHSANSTVLVCQIKNRYRPLVFGKSRVYIEILEGRSVRDAHGTTCKSGKGIVKRCGVEKLYRGGSSYIDYI